MDYTPLLRAALVRMDRWVAEQEAPPPSGYPRLADGTAVAPEQPKAVFAAFPEVGFPAYLPQVRRLDFGSDAERGVATKLPPEVGKRYPHFVPAVDPDGNEMSGVRLPDLTVPLATYTGWNLRHANGRFRPADEPDRLDDRLRAAGTAFAYVLDQERRASHTMAAGASSAGSRRSNAAARVDRY